MMVGITPLATTAMSCAEPAVLNLAPAGLQPARHAAQDITKFQPVAILVITYAINVFNRSKYVSKQKRNAKPVYFIALIV